jgi:D-serine deaminase-like pyridoxal phosphate-dependent protein
MQYEWWGDEHGRIVVAQNSRRRPEIGEVFELVVSHCDPTVNLFSEFYITRNEIVTDVWPIDMRGKSQ